MKRLLAALALLAVTVPTAFADYVASDFPENFVGQFQRTTPSNSVNSLPITGTFDATNGITVSMWYNVTD